jgi:hypothetical protein
LDWLKNFFGPQAYLSTFFVGMGYSFSFTAPFSVGAFYELAPHVHPLLGGLIGGVGASLADLFIFSFLRFTFFDEIEMLMASFTERFHHVLHQSTLYERLRPYLLWTLGGLIIASPLPDELGMVIIGRQGQVHPRLFMALCFVLNTIGIIAILASVRAVA